MLGSLKQAEVLHIPFGLYWADSIEPFSTTNSYKKANLRILKLSSVLGTTNIHFAPCATDSTLQTPQQGSARADTIPSDVRVRVRPGDGGRGEGRLR